LCTDAGMDDFLAKPVNVKTLAETIARWVAGPKGTASDTVFGQGEGS